MLDERNIPENIVYGGERWKASVIIFTQFLFPGYEIRAKLAYVVFTNWIWRAQLQKSIKFVSNDESKQLKSTSFMSDVCTCKILNVSNSFSTKSISKQNDEQWIHKITNKKFIFFTAWLCTNTLFGWRVEEGTEWKEKKTFYWIVFGWQNYVGGEWYIRLKV